MRISEMVKGRWRDKWNGREDLSKAKKIFDSALASADVPALKREEILRTPDPAKRSVNARLRSYAARELVPELRRAREDVQTLRREFETEREKLGTPAMDRALAPARHAERERLRRMRPDERARVLLNKPDRALLAAVLEDPTHADVDPKVLKHARQVYVAANFPDELAALEEKAEAIDTASMGVELAISRIQVSAGFGIADFAYWFDIGSKSEAA